MPFTLDQLVIFAAGWGNLALLRERVAAGGSVNHVDARHGAALIEVIRVGNLAIVPWLLENGADPNVELGPQIGPLEVALRGADPT